MAQHRSRAQVHLELRPGELLYLSPAGMELNQMQIDTHLQIGSDLDQTPLGDGASVALVLDESDGQVETLILGAASEEPVHNVFPQWDDSASVPRVLYLGGMVDTDPIVLVELKADVSIDDFIHADVGFVRAFTARDTTYAIISVGADTQEVEPLISNARIFFGRHFLNTHEVENAWDTGKIYTEEVSSTDIFSNRPFETWHRILRRQDFPLNVWGTWLPSPEFN